MSQASSELARIEQSSDLYGALAYGWKVGQSLRGANLTGDPSVLYEAIVVPVEKVPVQSCKRTCVVADSLLAVGSDSCRSNHLILSM